MIFLIVRANKHFFKPTFLLGFYSYLRNNRVNLIYVNVMLTLIPQYNKNRHIHIKSLLTAFSVLNDVFCLCYGESEKKITFKITFVKVMLTSYIKSCLGRH